MFLFPEDHAGVAAIYVLHHGRDLRVNLSERLHEVVLRREHRGRGDQDYHDLPCGMGGAHQDMAQEAVSGILIEYLHFEGWKKFTDRSDDLIRLFVLDQACLHRENRVGSLFVYAGDDTAFPVAGHDCMDLVPVMERVVHADDLLNPAERAEKIRNLFLFVL